MSTPRIGFVIGGMQKAGTSALASYLAEHPALRLPTGKEAHVFDAPAFDESATAADIDAAYAPHFPPGASDALHGDATPIYAFHPRLVARIARYNPAMRWIVLLRHPVDRALSHFHMERGRGKEHWPLWPAMLLERWRLRGHRDDLSALSPLRRWSYRARGDYAPQLESIRAHFPADQLLVLSDTDLRLQPGPTLDRACTFLGVAPFDPPPAPREVFAGSYPGRGRRGPSWWLLRWLLRREVQDYRTRVD